jgi:pimeloyl-ACP methyl ester carboxylesterase
MARRDPETLIPRAWGFRSAARFVSLFRPGEAEDVFQYYRSDGDWRALGRIRVPTAVIVGSRDEYLDRRAATLVAAFERHAVATPAFTGIIVPRASHGFRGHETVLITAGASAPARSSAGCGRWGSGGWTRSSGFSPVWP